MRLSRDAEAIYRLQTYGGASGIEGVVDVPLKRFNDDGGSMTELLRPTETPPEGLAGFELAQMNYSTVEPGIIKAFHVHRKQSDVWFVPPEDRVLLVLVDLREGSPTEGNLQRMMLGDGRTRLVRIPPGVAHGCRNLGSHAARIVYFTDRVFSPDPETCDEGRLDWDFRGPEVWESARE